MKDQQVSKGSETPSNSNPSDEPSKSTPPTPEKTGGKTNAGNEFPNTATNTYNLILVGLVLLVAGTALW
ncbi:LPXTG cell wall anchor domain-containing protein [Bacillus spizizenii]|uniref:LPXTG cell wall anchor domain-containing protein n=1 Tax=Bacillus spizizenii TaxID=96241 RepID=UPI0022811B31|nr:LPXTG cell wall anchor domain-containing protein [Bacillus spizizenii]MCY7876543.1 LPXTG cell wall anchor domain-containing protein [Bacillus spizizenii]MCY8063148.1 LPXTG cell wall anchor domain-containing protein [Bacillus spizizenii]MCY8133688.1 LPXTG cell wall anchor domain-containing protein [Bacillus spizizenii]MCY8156484.1 LPXTG cell wall anchor domain-containing protein [Bacillus spizizenii]MCY8257466.1 LPXTG cell wall anchor domain-containing protein [Bacillus spizizenii]